jgi:hypothetical protein
MRKRIEHTQTADSSRSYLKAFLMGFNFSGRVAHFSALTPPDCQKLGAGAARTQAD